MAFELNYGFIFILFFLTLGPLKAILPFARVTNGADRDFRRTVAWRGVAIGIVIALAVAIFGPLVLLNWHVSTAAVVITCAIILFYQALHVVMQTPSGPPGSAGQEASPPQPSPAVAVFPIAIPGIVSGPGIAAIAAIELLVQPDLVHHLIVILILLAIMALNLLTLLNNEKILRSGLAGVLPIIGWVLAVLQASLAVQMVIYSLRLLEVLRWPSS